MEKELHTNESNNIDIHSTSLERKLSLALHKRYPVIWAADNIQELVLDDKATVENVYDVLAEIEDKCVHLSKLSKHPIKYPFSLSYFHSTFACAILHELLTYFHYDKRTIYLFTGTASFKRSESSEISAT